MIGISTSLSNIPPTFFAIKKEIQLILIIFMSHIFATKSIPVGQLTVWCPHPIPLPRGEGEPCCAYPIKYHTQYTIGITNPVVGTQLAVSAGSQQ